MTTASNLHRRSALRLQQLLYLVEESPLPDSYGSGAWSVDGGVFKGESIDRVHQGDGQHFRVPAAETVVSHTAYSS